MIAVSERSASVLEAIIAQAAAHPARPAVVQADTTVTYQTLFSRAGQLAAALRAAGIGREKTVISCLPRGVALSTSILGTWLAGGCHVPVDPAGPKLRREYIVRDSGALVAVISSEFDDQELAGADCTYIRLDAAGRLLHANDLPCDAVFCAPPRGEDAAYIIYTSGTTGRPKGVVVEHHGLAALAAEDERVFLAGTDERTLRVAQNSTPIFDMFFVEFCNMVFGRTLFVVGDGDGRDPERFAHFISDNDIDFLIATPTQIRAVLLAGQRQALASLEVLVVGGEAIDTELWKQLRALEGVRVYNAYGPTECTVIVTAAVVADNPGPVIGTEFPDVEAWVVDDAGAVVPDGQIGELWVSGKHVARGYLNPAPADATSFTKLLPPGVMSPIRAYRTGDRVRRDIRGQLEFLGRTDRQVNIRGHRIELGEVETALRACPGVSDAVVTTRSRAGEESLEAWAVLVPHVTLDEVRERLNSALPRYMMPVLTAIPAIPMLPSGKADTKALLDLGEPQTASADDGDQVGDMLGRIWSETLGRALIHDLDDFFAIGGNSLSATEMIMATRGELVPELPIRAIFDHPIFRDFRQQVVTRLGSSADRPKHAGTVP
jgi:amino acid adenylation domain-containing protein